MGISLQLALLCGALHSRCFLSKAILDVCQNREPQFSWSCPSCFRGQATLKHSLDFPFKSCTPCAVSIETLPLVEVPTRDLARKPCPKNKNKTHTDTHTHTNLPPFRGSYLQVYKYMIFDPPTSGLAKAKDGSRPWTGGHFYASQPSTFWGEEGRFYASRLGLVGAHFGLWLLFGTQKQASRTIVLSSEAF